MDIEITLPGRVSDESPAELGDQLTAAIFLLLRARGDHQHAAILEAAYTKDNPEWLRIANKMLDDKLTRAGVIAEMMTMQQEVELGELK